MSVTIITLEDLKEFKIELLKEIKVLLNISDFDATTGKKWIKSPQVKEMLKISHGTLQQLRKNNTIPNKKIGGIIYYNVDEIKKLLDSKTNICINKS
jgi:hypothetical protein